MKCRFAWLLAAGLLPAASRAETIHFDDAKPGELPAGWTATRTGTGEPKWVVVADDSAPSKPNVLQQSGTATYPVCLREQARLKDGFVEVKFKPVSGKEDQAGGVIWRAQDADNYYICRANAREDNVTVYKTVAGRRTALDIVGRQGSYGVGEKVATARWHTLRVEFTAARCKVFFNGKLLCEVEDRTFSDAGEVGLWTKADSVTCFDDFKYGEK